MDRCPNCGACQHCGHGGHPVVTQPWPWMPPYRPYRPWWYSTTPTPFRVTWGNTSGDTTISATTYS